MTGQSFRVSNMPGLGIWQDCEYARFTKGTEYV